VKIYDIFKKTKTQELNVTKREYILMHNESMGVGNSTNVLDSSRSQSAFENINIEHVDFPYLIDRYLDYDEIVQSFIFKNRQYNFPDTYEKGVAHTTTLDRPESNIFLSRQFGTSRGSFITSSITGTSGAYRLNSGLQGPTTFARSSDSSKEESEHELNKSSDSNLIINTK
jgi:hypothetical protein